MNATIAKTPVITQALGYRSDIDGLRALAILSVLLYHVGFPAFSGGFVGVDIFFVISGYLITHLIRREVLTTGTFAYKNFYMRRVRRLFPAFAVTMIASCIAGYYLFAPEALMQFGASVIAATLAVSNFFFWHLAGYFDTDALLKPALHTWSLSVEEQFYLFWPALLVFAITRRDDGSAFRLVIWLAIASFALNLVFQFSGTTITSDSRSAMFYLLPFRVFELAIGAVTVWLERYRPTNRTALEALAIAAFAAMLWPIFAFTQDTPFPSYNALLPCLGAGVMIGVGQRPSVKLIIDCRVAVALGIISYSVYLVHWPIVVFFTYAHGQTDVVNKLAICATAIVLGAALYFMIERPFKSKRALAAPRSFVTVAFGTGSALIAMGAAALLLNGLPWRFEPEIATLLDRHNDTLGLPKNPLHCFLKITETSDAMDPGCYQIRQRENRKSIILVGDSSAAGLYAGLRKVLGPDIDIYQWSSSACPPVLGPEIPHRPQCRGTNEHFFRAVLPENAYSLVILSTISFPDIFRDHFRETREAMIKLNRPFILLGFSTRFSDSPANLIARHGKLDGLDDYIASQMQNRCAGENGFDALANPDEYVSLKQMLCSKGRPRYREADRLLQSDSVHLSEYGSLVVAQQLEPKIRSRLHQ